MIRLVKTDNSNTDFQSLVQLLDADLTVKDGDDHDFYHQFNGIDVLKYVVVAYDDDQLVGCGALKPFDTTSVEVKRMFTQPKARGKGVATQILMTLEAWAKDLGYTHSILETGKRQPDAIGLYLKNGYNITANYEPYTNMDNSVCFRKEL
jgi:GNAT superfamily N-acetyltransferase